MPHYLLIDPETGRGFGSSSTEAPFYEPGEHEVPCSEEQASDPTAWMRVDGSLVAAPPFEEPPVPTAPVITAKADLFRRTTDAEAEMIDTALKAGSVRERLIFENAQYLDHADPLFETMRTALAGMFGEARADALLAPSPSV